MGFVTAYELALLWDAWLDHEDHCDHECFCGCGLTGPCPVYEAALRATVGVLDDQKAYTDEALRQQGEWSGGKATS